jgi:hypothetical protein
LLPMRRWRGHRRPCGARTICPRSSTFGTARRGIRAGGQSPEIADSVCLDRGRRPAQSAGSACGLNVSDARSVRRRTSILWADHQRGLRRRGSGRALPVCRRRSRRLCVRMAPGRRRWSRWSARSEARTYDLDQPEGRCGLVLRGRSATWGRPALPGCSTKLVSSATTIVIGCPPCGGSAVASVFWGRPARVPAGMRVSGADRG